TCAAAMYGYVLPVRVSPSPSASRLRLEPPTLCSYVRPTIHIYSLSLHDALPILLRQYPNFSGETTISGVRLQNIALDQLRSWIGDRKSTRLNSSHVTTSYAVFCLKTKQVHARPHLP